MNKKTLKGFEYLKQNYRPSDIQKLLNDSKTKREVYQALEVRSYALDKYIKLHNLFFEPINTPLHKKRRFAVFSTEKQDN